MAGDRHARHCDWSVLAIWIVAVVGGHLDAAEFVLIDQVIPVNGGFSDGGQTWDVRSERFRSGVPQNWLEPVDYVSNGSMSIRMRVIDLNIDRPGVFSSLRLWFSAPYDRPLMFYGLRDLTFSGPGEASVQVALSDVTHRFGEQPRDIWRTGLRRLGFKDYSSERAANGSFGSAPPFFIHVTVVVSDEPSVANPQGGFGGLGLEALDAVPPLRDLWQDGRLGAAWQAVRRLRDDHEHADLRDQVMAAVAAHLTSEQARLELLATSDPVAATQGIQHLMEQLAGYPDARDLRAVGRAITRTDDYRQAVRIADMGARLEAAISEMRRSLGGLRPLKADEAAQFQAVVRAIATMGADHADSPAWRRLYGMVGELGLLPVTP